MSSQRSHRSSGGGRRDRDRDRNDDYKDYDNGRGQTYDRRSTHSSRSEDSAERRRRKHKKKQPAKDDTRVTLGDSVMLMWDTMKGAISGKRD